MLVRSPQAAKLAEVVTQWGMSVRITDDGALVISGVSSDQIGEMAATHGVVLHELSPQQGSLEEAFMRLTGDAVEYHADELLTAGK